MTALAKLVEAARPQFGGRLAPIARAMGVSLSALARAMKGKNALGAEALIGLADVIGERPDVVLDAAGLHDTARRLRRAYGRGARPLSDVDRALVSLPAVKKRAVRSLFTD